MSLMGTLAKVAIGVVIAKGVSGMVGKAQTGNAGGDGTFGGTHSPGRTTGLEDMMGDILGGGGKQTAPSAPSGQGGIFGGATSGGGGLGDLLEGLAGGHTQPGTTSSQPSGGGLGDLIGQLGGAGGTAGGLGGLLGGLVNTLGASAGSAAPADNRSFGDLLNDSFRNKGEPPVAPTPHQDAAAALMLRAMIQAAKSDGKIDDGEKKKLLGNLGDASPQEISFVQQELEAPIDLQGLVRQVPNGLGPQVYAMSVMAIDLDNQNEAKYLHGLATSLGINQQQVNTIHAKLGVPALYA